MICTIISMEVHTWSSNYLRAKRAFSDHGMQWMRGVCYAAFDVMTGCHIRTTASPAWALHLAGTLYTSYYRVTDMQTHTQTHVYVWKDTCAKECRIDAHKSLKMGTALQGHWEQTSPGFLQDCEICLAPECVHLTHIALECIWLRNLSAPCPSPNVVIPLMVTHKRRIFTQNWKILDENEHIISFHSKIQRAEGDIEHICLLHRWCHSEAIPDVEAVK